MIPLGIALLTIGVVDVVVGDLEGWPTPGRDLWAAGAGVVTLLVASIAVGLDVSRVLVLLILVGAGTAGWVYARRGEVTPTSTAIGLGLLGTTLVAVLLIGPGMPIHGGVLMRLQEMSDVPVIAATSPQRLVLGLGVVVALFATANAVVRSVLVLAGPDVVRSETHLRGGRLIGPLERLLIFGLALAGEPTAAALVVAAKSLLRFPELTTLSAAARRDPGDGPSLQGVDAVTEYFLLGSLASWSVALLPAVLFAGQ